MRPARCRMAWAGACSNCDIFERGSTVSILVGAELKFKDRTRARGVAVVAETACGRRNLRDLSGASESGVS